MPSALDDLAQRFHECSLPKGEWTHEAHLRVGAWHVDRYGPETALQILRAGIRRLNDRHGTPNTDTSGYHETITVAYVRLIAEFLADPRHPGTLEERVEALVSGPLGERSVLATVWSKEVLLSARARRAWVPPDLGELVLASLDPR